MSKMSLLTVILTFVSVASAAPEATFDVTLFPAGSFTGKAEQIVGFATMEGNRVKAENIRVSLKGLKTGIELRDSHTQKYLETDKHPEAILLRAEGQSGQGKGVLKIKGIEKEVKGNYKVTGNELSAAFKVKLSDFNITGVKYMGVGVDDMVVVKVKVPVKAGSAGTLAVAPVAPTPAGAQKAALPNQKRAPTKKK